MKTCVYSWDTFYWSFTEVIKSLTKCGDNLEDSSFKVLCNGFWHIDL